MRRFKFDVGSIAALTIVAGMMFVPLMAHGDIFVSSQSGIGDYMDAGVAVNPSVISGIGITSFAVSGSSIFVADSIYGPEFGVSEYTTSGGIISVPLFTPSLAAVGIVVSGSDLFVLEHAPSDSISEFTTSGASVQTVVSGGPPFLLDSTDEVVALSGSDLYVTGSNGYVVEYDTSGTLIDATLVQKMGAVTGMAVSGNDIFIAYGASGTIDEYTTSGVPISVPLISGLNDPAGIAISGSDIFVAIAGAGTIGEYTTAGAPVNANLISGLTNPTGIAITDVPEPASLSLLLLGGVAMLKRRRRMPQISQ